MVGKVVEVLNGQVFYEFQVANEWNQLGEVVNAHVFGLSVAIVEVGHETDETLLLKSYRTEISQKGSGRHVGYVEGLEVTHVVTYVKVEAVQKSILS